MRMVGEGMAKTLEKFLDDHLEFEGQVIEAIGKPKEDIQYPSKELNVKRRRAGPRDILTRIVVLPVPFHVIEINRNGALYGRISINGPRRRTGTGFGDRLGG